MNIEQEIKILELQLAQMEDEARTKEKLGKRIVVKTRRGWKQKVTK